MVSALLAIISGATLSCAFAPIDQWWLAPIAIAIFLYSVTKTRRSYLVAFIFGLTFNLLTLSWSGRYVGVMPWAILSILESLFFIPLGFISWKRERFSRIFLLPPVYLLMELMRTHYPFGGFGWNRIAFSQADAPYADVVRFISTSGLTLLTLYFGIAVYLLFSKPHSWALVSIIILITLCISIPNSALIGKPFDVLAIQGNVPRPGLNFNARATEVFNLHVQQTLRSVSHQTQLPDVIVWPENAVDVDPYSNPSVGLTITKIVDEFRTPLIFGAVLHHTGVLQNASILWNPDQGSGSIYIKRHLTPFGEYMPLRTLAEIVSPYAKDVADFTPSNEIVTHRVNEAVIGPVICFELIDDGAVRTMSAASNFLLVQTNSATFADTAESEQQLDITRIRAMENDRYAVSISTTGVSAFVTSSGHVYKKSSVDIAQSLQGTVQLAPVDSQTPSNRVGGYFPLINLGTSLGLYGLSRRRKEILTSADK